MIEAFIFIKTVLGWIGWLGIGLIPALACAAVVFFFPPFRTLAIAIGGAWVLAFTAYTLGDSHGADRVRNEWAAAVRLAGQQAINARESAEQETEHLEPEPEPPGDVTPVQPTLAPAVATCPPAPAPVCPSPPRARNDGVLRGDPNNRNVGRR